MTYAIVRRRGGLPEHPWDGTRIAEVSTCEFGDRHVRPGETVSYAVLAKRGDVESLAAVAAGPVIYLPDVREVRVEARECEIELSWIPPHGVHEIRVVRSFDSPPSGPRDGESVAARWTRRWTADVEQGRVYHYRIYAIYRTADGRRYPSPGVVVAAIPRSPVSPRRLPGYAHARRAGQARLDRAAAGLGPDSPHDQATALSPGTGSTWPRPSSLAGKWIDRTGPDRAVDLDRYAAELLLLHSASSRWEGR